MQKKELDSFDGPIDLLLHLIEKNKLDICEVSLSKVTDDFIGKIKDIKNTNIDKYSDFIYIASKLINLKSNRMLFIQNEDDEQTQGLVNQIALYSYYKKLSKELLLLYNTSYEHFEKLPDEFYAVEKFDFSKLKIENIDINIFSKYVKIDEEKIYKLYKEKKSISEKIDYIKLSVNNNGQNRISFNEILEEDSKEEKIVSLLGTLQLSKEDIIKINQEKNFDVILLEKNKDTYV